MAEREKIEEAEMRKRAEEARRIEIENEARGQRHDEAM